MFISKYFLDWMTSGCAKSADLTCDRGRDGGTLVKTPYVLLMGIPGINVVSAAEFAGEMGPIER